MDFSKLTNSELDEFLLLNGLPINGTLNQKIDQAAQLFIRLNQNPQKSYSLPVVDLYLVNHYLKQGSKVNQIYSEEQIRNLTFEQKLLFANLFKYDVNAANFTERLLRILRMLGALTPPPLPIVSTILPKITLPPSQIIPGKQVEPKIILPSSNVELHQLLWSKYPTQSKTYPIPIIYPVERSYNLEEIGEWRRLIGLEMVKFGVQPNFQTLNVAAVRKLYQLYNQHFFNLALPSRVNFEIAQRKTKVAGSCGPCPGKECECRYLIRISEATFVQLNLESGQKTQSGGLECQNRLECLQLVLEHELIHLAIQSTYPSRRKLDRKIYSAHGALFKELVRAYFGQTSSTHNIGQLILSEEQGDPLTPENTKIGTMVCYYSRTEEELVKGIIFRVSRVNISIERLDEKKVKIRKEFLRLVSPDDEDYEELEDLQKLVLDKLAYYRGLTIGETIQADFPSGPVTGKVIGINVRAYKLSIRTATSEYTLSYNLLIPPNLQTLQLTQVPPSLQIPPIKKINKDELQVGDSVLVSGGQKVIRGVIIKKNPVNAVVLDITNNVWTVSYAAIKKIEDPALSQLWNKYIRQEQNFNRLTIGQTVRFAFPNKSPLIGKIISLPKAGVVKVQVGSAIYKIRPNYLIWS